MLVSAERKISSPSRTSLSLSVKIPLFFTDAGNSPSLSPIINACFMPVVRSMDAEPTVTSSGEVGMVPILLSENISESAAENSSKVNDFSPKTLARS